MGLISPCSFVVKWPRKTTILLASSCRRTFSPPIQRCPRGQRRNPDSGTASSILLPLLGQSLAQQVRQPAPAFNTASGATVPLLVGLALFAIQGPARR